jgi:hypothetical protein
MNYYHNHPHLRIGDEIQTIALIKYLKSKGHEFYYKDSNNYFSAIELFPDNLVIFVVDNFYNATFFEPYNIWFWNPMMRDMGIYTELNHEYDESQADIDIVFIPLIAPGYNFERAIKIESAIATFNSLCEQFKDVRMIIDEQKKYLFKDADCYNKIIYSSNIYETFKYIRRSKIFVGTDTGTSHYAGALKHPRMALALPDETPLQNKLRWQRDIIAEKCNEPKIKKLDFDSLPCCDPKQYKINKILNNEIPINKLLDSINSF